MNAMQTGMMVPGQTTYYKLVDDIDMDGESWTPLNPDPFTKAVNLNGNGKTISNLNNALFQDFNGSASDLTLDHSTVSMNAVLGIFACHVNIGATISNVDITNSSLNASSSYCGGLIGQSANNINVSLSGVDVTNTNITGGLAGGIIGYPQGATTISNCHYNGGTITSNSQYTGGIAGATGSGKAIEISDCSVKNATITSAWNRCGGVIGDMRNGTTIERTTVGESESNVTITMTGSDACYTGGFIGLMEGGTISDNCKAYVNLTGVKTSIGGFIGRMTAGSVSGCKSYGEVSGPGTIGGFIGDVTGASGITLSDNESNCNVTATSTYVGGFVGYLKGSTSVSGCSYKTGKVWSNLGSGECYIGGFAGYIGTKSEAFTGTISGCLVSGAIVDAVKYKDDGVTAQSSGGWVGGFAGGIGHSTYANNTGIIQLCRVHNTPVSGGAYCGGFAGVSYSTIEKCGVSGKQTVQCYGNSNGGFIGYQQGHYVKYCYSNNNVRHANKSNVGGLIGNAKNTTVEECYSVGNLNNSIGSSTANATWGGMLGIINTVNYTKLIRWNHDNAALIVGNQGGSFPEDDYVKQSGDSNFQEKASDLGWSTDGSIWNYSGTTPALVGMP